MNEHRFRFDFLKVTKPLRFVSTEVLSKQQWDNIFYDGDFDSENTDEVRAIVQCPHCFKSWFDIGVRDFEKNNISDLVNHGWLSDADINNYHIAEIKRTGDFTIYKTQVGGSAHYVYVFCKRCSARHFIVLSLTEVQPTRYAGAVQGVWLVQE